MGRLPLLQTHRSSTNKVRPAVHAGSHHDCTSQMPSHGVLITVCCCHSLKGKCCRRTNSRSMRHSGTDCVQPCLAIAPPPQQRPQLYAREGVPLGQQAHTAGAVGNAASHPVSGCACPPGGCRQGRYRLAALLGSLGRCKPPGAGWLQRSLAGSWEGLQAGQGQAYCHAAEDGQPWGLQAGTQGSPLCSQGLRCCCSGAADGGQAGWLPHFGGQQLHAGEGALVQMAPALLHQEPQSEGAWHSRVADSVAVCPHPGALHSELCSHLGLLLWRGCQAGWTLARRQRRGSAGGSPGAPLPQSLGC